MDVHTRHKSLIAPLRAAMYDFSEQGVRAALDTLLTPDAAVRLCHPLGETSGPDGLYDTAYAPLFRAVPDLERRDQIGMAGRTDDGADWVGCGGYYTGQFAEPWRDIPPTRHQVHLRFHEFFRFDLLNHFLALHLGFNLSPKAKRYTLGTLFNDAVQSNKRSTTDK